MSADYSGFGSAVAGVLDVYVDDAFPGPDAVALASRLLDLAEQYGVRVGESS